VNTRKFKENNKMTIKKLVFIFLCLVYYSCQNPASYQNNTGNISAQNLTVEGLTPFEKITAISADGQLIDINSSGQIFLSATGYPVEIMGIPEIAEQPAGKKCSLVPEVPEAGDHPENEHGSWKLVCSEIQHYSLRGQVKGLIGKNLKLQLNNFAPINIIRNGDFLFEQVLEEKTPFEVKVVDHPDNPHQLCSVNRGRGILESQIDNIEVLCSSHVFLLSGTVSGQKSGFMISNQNGDSLYIKTNDLKFSFNEFIPAGSRYQVETLTHPYGQECYVIHDRGARVNRDITNIQIVCDDLIDLPTSLVISNNEKSQAGIDKWLHLWFYLDRNQVVYPVFKKSIPYVGKNDFRFSIPRGSYFVRAFIDMDGDQNPGIGDDFQSPLMKWVSNQGRLSISMENTSRDSGFQAFNAYIIRTSEWYQPRGGKCGGTYLKLESLNFKGNKNHLSPVYAILPDYRTIEFLDDGGCGDSFSNNASSYDKQSGDGQVSAGIDQEQGIQSGTYTFFYINYVTDKIHVAEDALSSAVAMSSFIRLLNPTGALPEQTVYPVFQWNSIPGAASYEILLESTDHSMNNYLDTRRFVKGNSYVAPYPLLDLKAYKVNIQAFDTDITEIIHGKNPDFDRVSQSPDQFFITDFSKNNSILVNGKLKNISGSTGYYLIYGDSNVETGNWESSIFLPPESTEYSLSLFKNQGKFGALISGINVDESGYLFSSINRVYARASQSLGFFQNLTLDLNWNKPLFLYAPVANDRGMGEYPVFSWEDYSPYTSLNISYILWISPRNSPGKTQVIGLENQTMDLGRWQPYSYFNSTELYLCASGKDKDKNGKTSFAGKNNQACGYKDENIRPEGLKEQNEWEWKVMVVPCVFQEYVRDIDNDGNGKSDYIDCLLKIFSGEKSAVVESTPNVFSTY